MWGNGKIIITTRDDNLEYNNYIPRKNIIRMTELNSQEKYNLFCSIIDHNCINHDDKEKDSLYSFLNQIPPFAQKAQ